MLKIALTGGIGSGKSAASKIFEQLGVDIIDADIISRELVSPGQPALQEISRIFGSEICQADGQLNRKKLRNIIFSNPEARHQLEALLHPMIQQTILERAAQARSAYVVMVIPLLTENKNDYGADRVLLIDAPEAIQAKRVIQRDKCSEEEFEKTLASQSKREQRRKIANDIILNDGTFEQLEEAVLKHHQQYLGIANG